MPLTFTDTPLYYKDSQGQYQRILSGADMTAYRTAAAQDVIDAGKEAAGLGLTGASAGDIVRVNAVDANGRPTSWKHVPLCEIKTNPNLLDNWYFVYGKAINNDYSSNGNFPVNQRGNQAYQIGSGTMYTVDRWILAGSDSLTAYSTILGNEDGLSNANANAFYQIIENPQRFAGKTATFSALIKRTVASSASRIGFVVNDSWFGEYGQLPNTPGDETVVSCTVTFGSSITSIKPWIYDDTGTYQLKAVKLELGSEQTLAHNEGTEENPVWVLNEIPDYGEELAKCQRYYLIIPSFRVSFKSAVHIGTNFYPQDSFVFPTMRNVPTFSADNITTGSQNQISLFTEAMTNSSCVSIFSIGDPGDWAQFRITLDANI